MNALLPVNNAVTAVERRTRMLRSALGPAIALALDDPDVVEIMLNPDGTLWLDRLSSAGESTGILTSPQDGERIVRLVAAQAGSEVNAATPLVSAELPLTGERFQG